MLRQLVLLLLPLAAFAWDRAKAFQFLEARQQAWAAWKPAQKPGGACMSCHTGLSHALALRAAGAPPTPQVRQLINGVKSRVLASPPQITLPDPGAEAIFNLFALSLHRPNAKAPLSKLDQAALKQLWDLQLPTGAWTWVDADLEPFDSPHSAYFGAALVEKALAAYPSQPAAKVNSLRRYLQRQAAQHPLHDRLAWLAFRQYQHPASTKAVLGDLWKAQEADGGWRTASLGPWTAHPEAPPDASSNAYATAWAAFAAKEAGTACSDVRLQRALTWLEQHQDAATGAWQAVSMNKVYPAGSLQEGFMTDAATGYAAAVLAACRP